jgi:hypothetical protein
MLSIERMASPVNRFYAIVARMKVFINFSFEMLLSADALITAAVRIMLSRIKTSG